MTLSRSLTILTATFAVVFTLPVTVHAQLASMAVEQISPTDYGMWTLLSADGETISSSQKDVDAKKYTAGLSKFGQMILIVTPPAGMNVRISAYRGSERISNQTSRQFAFTLFPNDNIRFVVQYLTGATGTLGVISETSDVVFRVDAPNGRTMRGKTPHTFLNVPIGRYTIHANGTDTCFKPAPQNVQVNQGERKIVTLSLTCEGATDEISLLRERISKRSIVNSVEVRESMRRSRTRVKADRLRS